jgi:RNA polymerase sigma factor (TIGR02999 family)
MLLTSCFFAEMTRKTVEFTVVNRCTDQSTDDFFETLYDELRRIARGMMASERDDHTLSATSLVNEAYLRLAPPNGKRGEWLSRPQFISVVAEAMRRILIDRARARATVKRRSVRKLIHLDSIGICTGESQDWILDLEDGLQILEKLDPQTAQLVKLRVFTGLPVIEAGRMLELSRWISYEKWDFAVAWFAARSSSIEAK